MTLSGYWQIMRAVRFIQAFIFLCTVLPAMDWLWTALDWHEPPKVWAFTAATFFTIIFLSLNYCVYAQQVVNDRLEECARAKAKFEKQILKKRRTTI